MAESTQPNPYATPAVDSERIGVYGGIRRSSYVVTISLSTIVLCLIEAGILVSFPPSLGGLLLLGAVFVVFLGSSIYFTSQRLINIGTSPKWCVALLVPLVGFVIAAGCLACPEVYEDHKTLDGLGRLVLGLSMAGVFLAIFTVLFGGLIF